MKTRWMLTLTAMALLTGRAAAQDGLQPVIVRGDKDKVEFHVGKDLVARYHGSGYAKPVFWPLLAPGGASLTRDWPLIADAPNNTKDHPHQKSAWFCHGDVIPEGIELKQKIRGVDGVDFWSEAPGHGKMACTALDVLPNRGFKSHNEWRTADGVKILDEDRTVLFHNFGKARLFDIRIDLHASACPIVFGDTKEGAFGVRINDAINASKTGRGKLQNAEGKIGEKDCWGQFSAWCDYSGPVDGKLVGLAIFADPKNPHPSAWHARGYGLMAANPFGRAVSKFPATLKSKELVRLAKGEHLQLRYGMLLHEGDAVTGQVADYYQRFVQMKGKE